MLRFLSLLAMVFVANGVSAQERPNVIIVMTDDQGLGDFSFTGNPLLKTPNFDAFAKESIRLTDFHVCPMCSPTRGQLVTGLTALRNGATSVTAGRTFLRPGLPTLPEAFAAAGYKTGLFGKWHLGDSYPHRPIDKGFGESIYHLGWGQLHSTPEFDWPLIDGRYFHNGIEKRYEGHCTDFWFDSAKAWIQERNANKEPFFCYIPTNAPHAPHIDLERFNKPYDKPGLPTGFFGMIAHLDDRFGDLDRFLTEQKLRDNTIVIFMTDNGGTAGVRIFNAGLRGHKTEYYEGGHRVPCWIRWPNGKLGQPRDIATPTQNTDLFPTLAEFCGLKLPERPAADQSYAGTNLAGLLRGQQPDLPERTLVVQYGQIPKKFESCIIHGKWRLVKGKELYDVEADRGQEHDVAATNGKVVEQLRTYYEQWWAGLEPTLNEFVPISLGAKQQPVVELTSGDWEGIYADNTGFVREAVGGPTGGHWHVLVETPGEYEITLRRWPEQTGAALGAKYTPSAKSPSNKPKVNTKGFPTIARAKLKIGNVSADVAADPKAQGATVTVTLPSGKTTLKGWFADANGNDLCGAFFVTVRAKPKPESKPQPTSEPQAKRPNVLWFVVDDMSANFSCYGEKQIQTPHVDRLAAEGTRFSRAFITAPVCSPCRSAMITGCYQTTIGSHHHRSGRGQQTITLPGEVVPVPALFQKAGYYTCIGGPLVKRAGAFGKTDYNFEWDKTIYDGNDWAGRKPGQPFFMQVQLHGGKYRGQNLNPNWQARVKRELGSNTAPKDVTLAPYYPRDPVLLQDWANYLDTCRYTDQEVGEVVARLEAEKLLDSTIIIFMTDHGISHARGKQFLYDEGIHIPFIVRGPGVPVSVVRDDLVEHIDMAAISLGLAGLPIPSWIQGQNVFAKDYTKREAVFSARDRCDETTDHIRSVRTADFKYIRNYLPHRPMLQPNAYKDEKIILQRLRELHTAGKLNDLQKKLLFAPERAPEELYDLARDPHELVNLATDPKHQPTLVAMRKRLQDWETRTNDRGRKPEPAAMYNSEMAEYLKSARSPEKLAELKRNIAQDRKWAENES